MDRLCELIRQECADVRFGIVRFAVHMEGGKVVRAVVEGKTRNVTYEEMPDPAEAAMKT